MKARDAAAIRTAFPRVASEELLTSNQRKFTPEQKASYLKSADPPGYRHCPRQTALNPFLRFLKIFSDNPLIFSCNLIQTDLYYQ